MKYIKGFDTLRAISIILVLTSHLGIHQLLPDNEFMRERLSLLISGQTGVQIFFTLSGFLITYILLYELNEFKKINFFNFYMRRFLRLLPPLIVFYIVIAILMKFRLIHTTSVGFLFSFFYLYNFVPAKYYSGELAHTWSLALEEQYYFVWPFIINFFNRKKVFMFIFLILLACIISIYLYPNLAFTKGFFPNRWFIPAVAPVLVGSLFAVLINNRDEYYEHYFKQKNKTILIAIILFLFPLYSPIVELSFLFQSIGISLLLVWIIYNQKSRLTSMLDNKALSYIGKISYGLYIYHGLFIKNGPYGDLWFQKFPQNIILTFTVAVLSFHLIESPILKLKKKFRSNKVKIQ